MKPDLVTLDDAIRAHHAEGRGRGTLRVKGFSKAQVIERWNALVKGLPGPEPRVGKRDAVADDEDGLVRLVRKGRLSPDQKAQAVRWRRLSRLAQLCAGPVKMANYDGVGGGRDHDLKADGALAEALAAKRELFELRWIVLRGEDEMLTVLDGVCVGGHTVRALAGGDGPRAMVLEAVLKVALNLLHNAANPPVQKAA
ncbi:MAG: hypothetical protein Q8L23_15855 [Caulobacter sp.]|nr:hypothetical protein [Caulobacter sp.]